MSDPYQDLVTQAEAVYQARLADPSSTLTQIADASYKWHLMKNDYASMTIAMTPSQWNEDIKRRTQHDLHYERLDGAAYAKKIAQISDLGKELQKDPSVLKSAWPGAQRSDSRPWFTQSSTEMNQALGLMASDLQDWANTQQITPEFLALSKEETLKKYLLERPIPFVILRLTQYLPGDENRPARRRPGYVTRRQKLDKVLLKVQTRGLNKLPPDLDPDVVQTGIPIEIINPGDSANTDLPPISNSDQLPPTKHPDAPRDPGQLSDDLNGPVNDPDYKVPDRPTPLLPELNGSDDSYFKPEGVEMPIEIVGAEIALTTFLTFFTPGLGQAYAAVEVLTGYNAFGYHLSNSERASEYMQLPYPKGH